MSKLEKYKITNGIFKNYYLDYEEWDSHHNHKPTLYDYNNKSIDTVNKGCSYNDRFLAYNDISRRKEEFLFNHKDKTVKYKSCGHWEEYDLESCYNNYPYILPSTTKDMNWKKYLNKTYKNFVPEKFEGILDFKVWGMNQELYLYFTDITNLNKYLLKVTNESGYKDNEGNIDFITDGNLNFVYEIQKSSDSKINPSIFNAKILSENIYFNLSDDFIEKNKGKFIARGLDVCTGEIICPKCNFDGNLTIDGNCYNYEEEPNILTVLTTEYLLNISEKPSVENNHDLISIKNPNQRIMQILNMDFEYEEFSNERIIHNNETSIRCRKCNEIILDSEIQNLEYLKNNLATNGNYEENSFLNPYEIIEAIKV